MKLNYLKVAQNKQTILDEVDEGKFKIDLSDYIIHLKSFIDKDTCKNIVEELKTFDVNMSWTENSKLSLYRVKS